ncbi:MAG TPA: hypothetical protein DCM48_00095 [Thalassospira sp.]|nr:hypothetical protein [Thalassospira sp.]
MPASFKAHDLFIAKFVITSEVSLLMQPPPGRNCAFWKAGSCCNFCDSVLFWCPVFDFQPNRVYGGLYGLAIIAGVFPVMLSLVGIAGKCRASIC